MSNHVSDSPFASKVLSKNCDETLHATNDGTVDHDWSFHLLALRADLCGTKLEVEALRKLEIELNRGALVLPAHSITDGDVDLWAIESTVTRVELPLARHEFVKRSRQTLYPKDRSTGESQQGSMYSPIVNKGAHLLSRVPGGDITEILLRPGRKLQLEGEAKEAVNALQEIEAA